MLDVITDPAVLEGYLTDASNVHGHAEALVRPNSAAEVAEVVRHCQSNAIPLTISAGRSSTTAAPVPFGGWLMSLERLDRIERIDHDTAVTEPGVRLGAFQTEVEAKGRFFPPDPTSRHECTLGAAIACNASGAWSFRYGPTRPWVEALEVVLPTGEIRTFRRGDPIPDGWPTPRWQEPTVKTAAGYAPPRDALDLFIGQEGTLGIITKCTVRLTGLPTGIMGFFAYFPDRESTLRFMERARTQSRADKHAALSPRCIEYFDYHCLSFARERIGDVPDEARAALFCEQEIEPAHDESGHLEAWWTALSEEGALVDFTVVASDPASQERLRTLRHAVPAGLNERVIRNGMPKVGTDLSVPDAALREMMDLYEASPFEHALFGHLGDNHLHLNLLPTTAEELASARAYYVGLARRAVELGGSVSAEHGIGKLKKNQLAFMVSPEVLESFRALKRHLDPNWILGPGTLFDAA